MIDKQLVCDMLTPVDGQKPKFWVRDWFGVSPVPGGGRYMQISVSQSRGPEPFPGLTQRVLELLRSDSTGDVLGAITEKDRQIINIALLPEGIQGKEDAPVAPAADGTHEEGH